MVALRRLRPDEWRDFRAIRIEALDADPGVFVATAADARARPEDYWRAMLDSDDGVVFGLFDGAIPVGLTAAFVDRAVAARDTVVFAMTWLRPAWRGRGLSRLIYAARIDWARAQGMRRIAVSHRAGNEPSRRAILAHGFTPVRAFSRRWPDGETADNIEYELPLSGA